MVHESLTLHGLPCQSFMACCAMLVAVPWASTCILILEGNGSDDFKELIIAKQQVQPCETRQAACRLGCVTGCLT
jgi:hypothetical protein